MSVNGVTSYAADYSAYTENLNKASTASKSTETAKQESTGVVYSSQMTEEQRAAIVKQLEEDSQRQIDSFKSMVMDMFHNQGMAVQNSDDLWKMLASGEYTVDEAAAKKAQELISEDGYWGVNQTSDRIFQMAMALSGGDEEGMNDMLEAFEKGFKAATKAWGKELPDISDQTYKAVQEKFKEYQESLKTAEVEA